MDTQKKRAGGRKKSVFRCLCLATAAVLVLGCAGCLILSGIMKSRCGSRILSPQEAAALQADCILVLGAGVRDDGTPSHMLEDRLRTGLSLYETGAAPKLLMSGDHGRVGYNEVGVMKAFAVRAGVPDGDVFMDHAGFSTYESLYRARDIFGAQKIIIVTQEYHLYRALYTAEQLGLEAYGVSADLRTYAGQGMREIREIAARVKDALWCLIQPEPTCLGEAIPISGDGGATNDAAYESEILLLRCSRA